MPTSPVGDQDRIRRLWNRNIPALPIPVGTKAGNDRVRPPRWKHLQDGRPTEADWKYWSNPEYARGNTAIIMGHAGDAACFSVIEVEYAEDFESHADRDYFLTNTPVVASAKSMHIWLLQRVGTKALGWKPARSDNDGDPNKHLPVRHEFRGAGSIDTAPGSIHQSGASIPRSIRTARQS